MGHTQRRRVQRVHPRMTGNTSKSSPCLSPDFQPGVAWRHPTRAPAACFDVKAPPWPSQIPNMLVGSTVGASWPSKIPNMLVGSAVGAPLASGSRGMGLCLFRGRRNETEDRDTACAQCLVLYVDEGNQTNNYTQLIK